MKKTILTLALMAIAIMGAAQTKTYRQNINQEIRQLIVQGNCIVHLQQDTENWVAYKGTEKPDCHYRKQCPHHHPCGKQQNPLHRNHGRKGLQP